MYVLFIHYLQRQSRREVTINQLINQGGIPTKVLSTLHHESTINASPRKYDQLVYYIIITLTNFIYFAFTLIANNRPKIGTLYVDSILLARKFANLNFAKMAKNVALANFRQGLMSMILTTIPKSVKVSSQTAIRI